MILSRFMWLELLSKSNILRPIPLYMMKRKNTFEFFYIYDLVMLRHMYNRKHVDSYMQ